MKNSTSKSNVISQIFFAAVAVILGYLLLFDKTVQIVTLCQILCGGLIFVGVVSIVAYFLGGDFKRIDRYGFAIGVMLILAGIIGLIRIGDLTANFEMFAAAFSLVLGVLILQGTVQIKVLDYAAWILTLILTIACLAGAFCVLAGVKPVTNLVAGFSSWLLLICGGSCLFSMIVTWICILLAGRREKKLAKEKEEQAAAYAAAQAEAQAAAQAEAQAAAQAAAQAVSYTTVQAETQSAAQMGAQSVAKPGAQSASGPLFQSHSQSAHDDILPGEYHQITTPPSSFGQPGSGQSGSGQASIGQASSDQPGSGQASSGQASSDQAGSGQAAAAGPSEAHHTGFDAAADASSDLPPLESPHLEFEPSEGHHTDFDPSK